MKKWEGGGTTKELEEEKARENGNGDGENVNAWGVERGSGANRDQGGGGKQGGGNGGDRGWDRGQNTPAGKGSNSGNKSPSGGYQNPGWSRGQSQPKPARDTSSRTGGKGDDRRRGGRDSQSEFTGYVAPLELSENRWIPVKDNAAITVCEKKVKSILNKMTKEKFERLAEQICEIKVESMDMLDLMIARVFEKAIDEPAFGDMYAELCVKMSNKVTSDSFVSIIPAVAGQAAGEEPSAYYWSADISTTDAEVVGPFDSSAESITAALDADVQSERIKREEMQLELTELKVIEGMFIKVMQPVGQGNDEDGEIKQYYTVYFATEDAAESGQQLVGPFADFDACAADSQKKNSFKRSLLNKCQDEFQKQDIYKDWKVEKKEFDDKKSDFTAEEQVAMSGEFEFRRTKIKKQMLGNIRFIGELYKKSMLKEYIMHECITVLMKIDVTQDESTGKLITTDIVNETIDEEDHEALCKLFQTIGKSMDNAKSKGKMNEYFKKCKQLADNQAFPSRMRFMYQDLIDLRSNNWVTRRKEEVAKTLNEIRADIDREERLQAQNAAAQNRGGGGQGFQQNSRGGQPADQYRGDRGDRRDNRSDSRGGSNAPQMQNGRDGRDSRSSSASTGGRATSGSTVGNDNRIGKNFMANRAQSNSSAPRGGSVSSSSEGKTRILSSSRPGASAVPVKPRTLGPSSGMGSYRGSGREASTPPPVDENATLSEEKLKSKIKGMMKECSVNSDAKELSITMVEIFSTNPDAGAMVVRVAADEALDCKDAARPAFSEVLVLLFEAKHLATDNFQGGLSDSVEFLAEFIMDVPKAVRNLAQLTAPLLSLGAIKLDWFCKTVELCPKETQTELFSELKTAGWERVS